MAKQDERELSICSNYRGTTHQEVPALRLTGPWFKQLGFGIGDRVRITTREKLLIIQPIKDHGNTTA